MNQFHLNKEEILNIMDKEILNLRGSDFFHLKKSNKLLNKSDVFLENRIKHSDQEEIKTCKVCAIGAILRNKFNFDEIIRNHLLTNSVKHNYTPEEDYSFLIEETNKDTILTEILKDPALEDAFKEKQYLSALSIFFEAIIDNDDKNLVKELLEDFINQYLPETITIDITL